jgi:uncharacterized protein (TIGR03435 family)
MMGVRASTEDSEAVGRLETSEIVRAQFGLGRLSVRRGLGHDEVDAAEDGMCCNSDDGGYRLDHDVCCNDGAAGDNEKCAARAKGHRWGLARTLVFPGSNGQSGGKFRLVLRISKKPDGSWSALNYSIDQGPQPMQTAAVSLQGDVFRFSIPALNGSYEGHLSADGHTIAGSWTQVAALPLVFVRAIKDTAWEIPAPVPPSKPMAADADPSFDVATIKPTSPEVSEKYFRVYGRRFMTQNTSLADLIEVAYGIHSKQIVGEPGWVRDEKFDLVGVPNGEGEPSGKQWMTMLQKLLAQRFDLKFHHEQKVLSVYVLSAGKNGAKNLTKSESTYPLPSLEFQPVAAGLMLPARNATMMQFAGMLQAVVLDRPVVDQTGMVGEFDFRLLFTPNESEFSGHPPKSDGSEGSEAAPSLFEALQQQLGLRLTVEKIPTDVLVVDKVEKPSAN